MAPASTNFPFGIDPHIVWKSTDGGDTWSPLPYPQAAVDPISGIDVTDLAVASGGSGVDVLATEFALAGTAGGDGLYLSADGGETWNRTTLPHQGFQLALPAARPRTLWAVHPLGAYESTDDGATWTLRLRPDPAPNGSLLA